MVPTAWLLLLYCLPTKKAAERVSLWRKLKKFGALQLKTSAYLLPDAPLHFERFQWLAKQVRDGGGEATLIRVTEIEGLSNTEIAGMFNDARGEDYAELIQSITGLTRKKKRGRSETFDDDLEKLNRRFHEIREIDYFDCPAAQDVQMLLKRAEGPLKIRKFARLDPKKFVGKTWLTRPRPEIDRVSSAWFIQKFIDSKAKFIFAPSPRDHPEAIPYDMVDVELTH